MGVRHRTRQLEGYYNYDDEGDGDGDGVDGDGDPKAYPADEYSSKSGGSTTGSGTRASGGSTTGSGTRASGGSTTSSTTGYGGSGGGKANKYDSVGGGGGSYGSAGSGEKDTYSGYNGYSGYSGASSDSYSGRGSGFDSGGGFGSHHLPKASQMMNVKVPLIPAMIVAALITYCGMICTAFMYQVRPESVFTNCCRLSINCLRNGYAVAFHLYHCQLGEITPIVCALDDEDDLDDEELERMKPRPGIQKALTIEHRKALARIESDVNQTVQPKQTVMAKIFG